MLLAGIPGIALPARRRAWGYRGAIDLLVLHSHREVAEYDAVRVQMAKTARVGLATIPFLAAHPELPLAGDADPLEVAEGEAHAPTGVRGNRVIFATQGKVPVEKDDRLAILLALDRLAAARPDLRVVVKTRGQKGEFHTHYEPHHYEDLWRSLVASHQVRDRAALEFAGGSMAEQLETAAALVTVSSTAVLEAMARNIPVLLVDEFGVDEKLLNQVFEGSGCLGGLKARGDRGLPPTRRPGGCSTTTSTRRRRTPGSRCWTSSSPRPARAGCRRSRRASTPRAARAGAVATAGASPPPAAPSPAAASACGSGASSATTRRAISPGAA